MTAQQPLFQPDTHQPNGNCPMCRGKDGWPNGKWPRVLQLRWGQRTEQCPNCGGSGNPKVPY